MPCPTTLLAYSRLQSDPEEDSLETLFGTVAQRLIERGHLSIRSEGPWLQNTTKRKSLLYLAVEVGDISFARFVLNHKDWNCQDINENFTTTSWRFTKTVLHLAQEKGHTEIADLPDSVELIAKPFRQAELGRRLDGLLRKRTEPAGLPLLPC